MLKRLSMLLISSLLFCACSDDDDDGRRKNENIYTYTNENGNSYAVSNDSSLYVNGHDCSKDSECLSGNCYNNTICRAKNWDPSMINGAEDGRPCETNKGCLNNLCVNNICSSSTSVELNVTNNSISGNNQVGLGNKLAGDTCSKSTECESGLCLDHACSDDCRTYGCNLPYYVCRYDKCIPVETIGSECQKSSDCPVGRTCCNGFCNTTRCEVGIACESRRDGDTWGLTRFSECANKCNLSSNWGGICTCDSDAQCGDDYYCEEYGSYLCLEKKPEGASCTRNAECKLNSCFGRICNNH